MIDPSQAIFKKTSKTQQHQDTDDEDVEIKFNERALRLQRRHLKLVDSLTGTDQFKTPPTHRTEPRTRSLSGTRPTVPTFEIDAEESGKDKTTPTKRKPKRQLCLNLEKLNLLPTQTVKATVPTSPKSPTPQSGYTVPTAAATTSSPQATPINLTPADDTVPTSPKDQQTTGTAKTSEPTLPKTPDNKKRSSNSNTPSPKKLKTDNKVQQTPPSGHQAKDPESGNKPQQGKMATVKEKQIAALAGKYPYSYTDSEDEVLDDAKQSKDEQLTILRRRRRKKREMEELEERRAMRENFRLLSLGHAEKDKPKFSNLKGEKPQPHILLVEDWQRKKGFTDQEMVKEFKETLEGTPRMWYEELETLDMTWERLKTEFIREFHKDGKSNYALKREQNRLEFNPEKDSIKEFIRDVKATAKILKNSEEETRDILAEAMPEQLYLAVANIPDLDGMCAALIRAVEGIKNKKRISEKTKDTDTGSPFMVLDQSSQRQNSRSNSKNLLLRTVPIIIPLLLLLFSGSL